MIISFKKNTDAAAIEAVKKRIEAADLTPVVMNGTERTVIAVIGDERKLDVQQFKAIPSIENVMPVLKPYKLASRETHPEDTIIECNGVKIGGNNIVVMAGPCSVESEEGMLEIAHAVKKMGATFLRGGAFKPRTSPYSFQGHGEAGLKMMKVAKEATGLGLITEVMDTADVELICEYADILQVGARNSQNFALLKKLGKCGKPVMLKRGISGTISELLMSAEYILAHGNPNVILCERGIRTFETATRNTTDINAIPVLKSKTHLPIILDPSHSTGKYSLVAPLAMAGVAAGADALIVEVHPRPEEAFSDGAQSLTFSHFQEMMDKVTRIAHAVDRDIASL